MGIIYYPIKEHFVLEGNVFKAETKSSINILSDFKKEQCDGRRAGSFPVCRTIMLQTNVFKTF